MVKGLKAFIVMAVLAWTVIPIRAWAQDSLADSVLPKDHLLENLPWLSDDGKIESKGLFDFEDVRGLNQRDLVLIYRQSVPVSDLDKPHSQTLAVCFYDPTQKKYIKNFTDDGGPILWVKVYTDPEKRHVFLLSQRDDLKGNQVIRGYAYLAGTLKQVLEVASPQLYASVTASQVLCSAKEAPKDSASAEHTFSWDETQSQFVDKMVVASAGTWSGSSIRVATPVPTAVPAAAIAAAASTPSAPAVVSAPKKQGKGWWDEPLDAQASLTKLKTELVPARIQANKIVQLGQEATAFFNEVHKTGIAKKDFASMRATYYAAVAQAILDKGDKKGAAFYVKTAMSFQADNPDALAVQAKLK